MGFRHASGVGGFLVQRRSQVRKEHMANTTFKTIGVGFTHKTDKSQGIHLYLDPAAQKFIYSNDFERGIFVFEKTSKAGKRYYSVAAPMPGEYEYTPVEVKNDREPTA
jgi:hypothetical protein